MGRKALGSSMVVLALLLTASSAHAQGFRIGGQLSFGDDTDFGIGPRVGVGLPNVISGLWLVGSFDYFFPDEGFRGSGASVDYWELNANLIYPVTLPDVTNLQPYFGGGVNIAHASVTPPESSVTDTDTRFGLNVLAGLDFPLQGFTPFVEARLEIEGGDQFVVTGGITFP
ncbi:MAG: porin family protein [Gemmatimonadetes bacterium]|nr:porin family protein [Gemmatimonadota bacterium]